MISAAFGYRRDVPIEFPGGWRTTTGAQTRAPSKSADRVGG
jgi:hypothetical protein